MKPKNADWQRSEDVSLAKVFLLSLIALLALIVAGGVLNSTKRFQIPGPAKPVTQLKKRLIANRSGNEQATSSAIEGPLAQRLHSGDLAGGLPETMMPTYQRVAEFIGTGDFRAAQAIDIKDVRALADSVARSPDRERALALLEELLGMPSDLAPSDAEQIPDFLTGWFAAARGDQVPSIGSVSAGPVGIGFSSATDDSGAILSTCASFAAGEGTIYGVFENRAWPADSAQVLAIWRDEDQGKIVFQETESIRPGESSNYVWLRGEQGWPAGHWQLDLYDPKRNFQLVATGQFVTH